MGARVKADVCVATKLDNFMLSESEVVFMVDILAFLYIGFMFSLTLNVALLTLLYILLTNKE